MSLLKTLQQMVQTPKSPFKVSNVSIASKDGHVYDANYSGGCSLTEEKIVAGKAVVTVTDDKGVTHVLGENFR